MDLKKKHFSKLQDDVNIKDFENSHWLGYFVIEIFFVTLSILLAFLLRKTIQSRISKRLNSQQIDLEMKTNRETTDRMEGNLTTERARNSNFYSRRVSCEKEKQNQLCCFCFHCKCMPKFWKCFLISIDVVILIFDLYTIISESLILRQARFEGTQFIIYNNSQIISNEFLEYDREKADYLIAQNSSILHSNIQSYLEVNVIEARNFNLTKCYTYSPEEIEKTKIIYRLLPGAFTLLFLNIFINSALIFKDVVDILTVNLIPRVWISILLSLTLKAFSSAKLGFSFYNLKNDCLNPIEYFQIFFYVYIVYSVAYLVVWVTIFALCIFLLIHLCKKIRSNVKIVDKYQNNNKKIFSCFLYVISGIIIAAGSGIIICGLIGFIIFKIIWILDGFKTFVPAITSILSFSGSLI